MNDEIKAAKKFFDRHILNKISWVTDFEGLPKKFRQKVFPKETGKKYFYDYASRGDFFWVTGKDRFFMVYMTPNELTIVDHFDRHKTESDVEWDLNLPIVGLRLREFLEMVKKNKEEKLVESKLKFLIKKIILEHKKNWNS